MAAVTVTLIVTVFFLSAVMSTVVEPAATPVIVITPAESMDAVAVLVEADVAATLVSEEKFVMVTVAVFAATTETDVVLKTIALFIT